MEYNYNVHMNGDVFNFFDGKDDQYIGRIDSDGNFIMPHGMVPQAEQEKHIASEVKENLQAQFDSGDFWDWFETKPYPLDVLKFIDRKIETAESEI